MLDLEKQCPELLTQLIGLPNDGAGTALEDIYLESKLNQITLRTSLGLAENETGVIINMEQDMEKSFALSKEIIFSLLDEKDVEFLKANPQNLWENRLESGMKITKAIARSVASNEHLTKLFSFIYDKSRDDYFWSNLKEELPKIPDLEAMQLIKDPMVFVQNFVSEVSIAKTKQIGFTLDMFDFIRGCNSSSYTSCYTINRDFNSMAPVTYALSGKAGMIFNRNSSGILGRCWVIFANNMKSFVVMKPYGFISEDSIHAVACKICSLLDPKANWYKGSRTHDCLNTTVPGVGIYGDPIHYGYSCQISNKDSTPVIQTDIDNTSSRCIMCGSKVSSSTIMCNKCKRGFKKCTNCGTYMTAQAASQSDTCPKCSPKFKVCKHCGKKYDSASTCMCSVKHTTCSFCDSPAVITTFGIGLCEDCVKIVHNTGGVCEVCGNKGLLYPYKKHALCRRCFALSVSTASCYAASYDEEIKDKIMAIRQE